MKNLRHYKNNFLIGLIAIAFLSLPVNAPVNLYAQNADPSAAMTAEDSFSAPETATDPNAVSDPNATPADSTDPNAVPETAPDLTTISQPVEIDSRQATEVQMVKGDLEAIKVYSLVRVSISNPDIADIANADSEQILMLAKKPGQTLLFIWDQYGKRTISIQVFDENLQHVQTRLRTLLDKAELQNVKLEINNLEGKIMVSGEIPPDKKQDAANILDPFSGSLINMIKIQPTQDLVQVDVQISELNTSLTESIGFDWNSALTYAETPSTFNANDARDLFKVGPLSRTTQIVTVVNALVTEGKGRILSKPKLVVISGKEASFLVGGEVPIRTSNVSAGGNVQENVEFKDYGVSLTITPTIKDGKVDVILSVEVSDIDSSQPVPDDIAFLTRTAQTQILLEDGQTMVMAGLIKQQRGAIIRKVPFLGDIPIVGLIFRHKSTQGPNQDTELVISLTPTIIKQRQKVSEAELAAMAAQAKANADEHNAAAAQQEAEAQAQATAAEMSEDEEIPESMTAYVQAIQQKISQAISYPAEARVKGWEGTVKLSMHLLRDGSLKEISLKESSGQSVFDQDALNTAQVLAPYGEFPEDFKNDELLVTVPIVYSKDSASEAVPTDEASAPQEQTVSENAVNPSENGQPVVSSSGLSYSQQVQRRIAEAIVYPQEAREKGWEGTSKLSLRILRDGTLATASIAESSGFEVLDQCALQTAQNVAPFSTFPEDSGLEELELTVPIVYSLKSGN